MESCGRTNRPQGKGNKMTISELYLWAKEKGIENNNLNIYYLCFDDYYGGEFDFNTENLEVTEKTVTIMIK